jgi:hypothetical protein
MKARWDEFMQGENKIPAKKCKYCKVIYYGEYCPNCGEPSEN